MSVRETWTENCEKAVNQHIRVEYMASYHYHLLASYFYRLDVGLDKLGDYFNEASKEEREHADKFIKYQCMRGGKVELFPISVPELNLNSPYTADLLWEDFIYLLKNLYKEDIEEHNY